MFVYHMTTSSQTVLYSETANSACGSSPEAVMIRVGTKAQAGLLLAEAYMARTLVQISEDGVERTIGIKKHRLN